MEWKEMLENIKKENGEVPKPLQLLGELDETLAINHIADKKFAYSKATLSPKYKALIALAVAIAMDAQACILNNTKAAKKAGASTAEIMEAFAIAKFSKGASALSSSASALEWLAGNK
ncbi:MAG: carboxymuconolactone decarboxylase family protein [Firmicutes bacterium]|nr:carboxymuconolactone decarboxylase family protein [Bacillota bacterium]